MGFQLTMQVNEAKASKVQPENSLMATEDRIDALLNHPNEVVCCRCGEVLAKNLTELAEACEADEVTIGRLNRVRLPDGKYKTGYSIQHDKNEVPCEAPYSKDFWIAATAHNYPLLVEGELEGVPDGHQVRRTPEAELTVAPFRGNKAKEAPKAKTAPKAKAPKQSKAKRSPLEKGLIELAKLTEEHKAKPEPKASMQAAKKAGELTKLRAENKSLKARLEKLEGFMEALKGLSL